MKKLLLILLLLFSQVLSADQFAIITSQASGPQRLQVGVTLISTLGYFKLIIQQNNCQLGIYQFDQSTNTYQFTDSYVNRQSGNCKSIKIENYRAITDTGFQIAKFSSPNFQKSWLTIDDKGTIRLIGINKRQSLTSISSSQEVVLFSLPQNKLKQKNIQTDSQFKLDSYTTRYISPQNWVFQASNNQLQIYKLTKPSLSQKFSLQNINLDRSGIYDNKNRTSPFALFQKALIFPQCDLRKTQCEHKAPYTIEFSDYWPVARIYDQEKYLVAQFSVGQSSNLEKRRICPPGSFIYKQLCLKKCPSPYYGKVEGPYGQCVLTCQEGSIVNDQQKICSCSYKDLYQNPEDTQSIKKCEHEWTPYFYGCDCSSINKVYDRLNSLACQSTCPSKSFADSGVCFECQQNCLSCQRDDNFIKYLKCSECQKGYTLNNGECVKETQTCESNCNQCKLSQCTQCVNFYSLYQGNCLLSCPTGFVQTSVTGKGYICLPISNSNNNSPQSSCYAGCIQCSGQQCLQCAIGYILYVSPLSSTCKLKTSSVTCYGDFTYDTQRQICYVDNIEGLNMAKCKSTIIKCQLCQFNKDNKCILCERGFYLHKNQCVEKCPNGFAKRNNVCEQQINDCQAQGQTINSQEQAVNLEIIKGSKAYKKQTANGQQPGNDIGGYALYMKELVLQQDSNNQTSKTLANYMQKQCLRCRRGYGLSDDSSSCLPCPSACQYQHCYFARQNSCFKQTIKCTFLDENSNCMQSCPDGRYPQIDSKNQTRCLPKSLASVNDYLKIDSSYYEQQDGSKIYYFVLDREVQNGTTNDSAAKLSFSHNDQNNKRMLVESSNVAQLQKNQFYGVRNTKQNAVAIAFDDNVNKFRTPFGFTLANSVYGAQAHYTHNQWMKEWLAHIGFVLSWVILIVHCLYIGNTILYKCDNLIIFCQTIYFFTFVKLLVGNTLAQYYYGWFWMHMGFWPNYFKGTIPNQYEERQAPISFKLATLDGNFIRNAGFAISLFISFLALWIVIVVVIWLVNKILGKNDIWYSRIAKNTLTGAIQLLSMVIFFFSVTQLLYGDDYPSSGQSFHTVNKVFSIIFICVISIYMIVSLVINTIGGLYMFKRLAIALILVNAYKIDGFLALLIAFQLAFTLTRFFLEKPRLLRQKIYMLIQSLLFILAYFLLFLVLVPGVNVMIITAIIFTLLLFLISDLMDVYLESRNQFYDFDILGQKYDNQSKHEEDIPDSQRKMNV